MIWAKKYIVFLCIIGFLSSCKRKILEPQNNQIEVTLLAPDSAMAGQKFYLKLKTKGVSAEASVFFIYHNNWGTSMQKIKAGYIEGIEKNAGLLTIQVVAEGMLLDEKKIKILPHKAVFPLDSYLGSKSIIANAKDWAMITAIPTDKFGNLTSVNTAVQFDLLRPNDSREKRISRTQYGIAYQKITARTKAGKTFVGVSVDDANSREKELLEVADFPKSFLIQTENISLNADARQTFRLKTNTLKDGYGNIMPDGTVVVFNCKDADGTIRTLSGYTLEGVTEVFIQNPSVAGLLSINAFVPGGGISNTLSLSFKVNDREIPFITNKITGKIKIGPVIGNLNQLVPNGTLIFIKTPQKIYQSEITDGFVILKLPVIPQNIDDIKISLSNSFNN